MGYQLRKPVLPRSLHQSEELRLVDRLGYRKEHTMNTILDEPPIHCLIFIGFICITHNFLCVFFFFFSFSKRQLHSLSLFQCVTCSYAI